MITDEQTLAGEVAQLKRQIQRELKEKSDRNFRRQSRQLSGITVVLLVAYLIQLVAFLFLEKNIVSSSTPYFCRSVPVPYPPFDSADCRSALRCCKVTGGAGYFGKAGRDSGTGGRPADGNRKVASGEQGTFHSPSAKSGTDRISREIEQRERHALQTESDIAETDSRIAGIKEQILEKVRERNERIRRLHRSISVCWFSTSSRISPCFSRIANTSCNSVIYSSNKIPRLLHNYLM